MAGVALVAALTAVLVAAAVAPLACLLLLPWNDIKALGALAAGAGAALVCTAKPLRNRVSRAGVGTGFAVALLFLLANCPPRRGLIHVAFGASLAGLVGEQVLVCATAGPSEERGASAGSSAAQDSGAVWDIVHLKDGSRALHLAEDRMLFISAADDHCEVRLEDGPTILVTMNLSRLEQALSDRSPRVHKTIR